MISGPDRFEKVLWSFLAICAVIVTISLALMIWTVMQ